MPRYPEHLRGFEYTGPHRYFLTMCTHQRARYFVDHQPVALVTGQFQRASREQAFAVIAFCFMPDHVHLLVAGERDDADLKRFSKDAKQYSGYERVLRNDETTPAVVRYIVANPVRGGIVHSLAEYPFWGSFVYTREALLEYIGQAA